jgi:pyruvate/2-oxoglutarate dehydrogenase complex dihydrolipoamide dehydrogenase (E3) component
MAPKSNPSWFLPYCTYTTIEIAIVGLYAHSMKEQGILFDPYSKGFDHVDRAICDGNKGQYTIR